MALFSSFFHCFQVPSSSSSRVSDHHIESAEPKVERSKSSSTSKSKSSKAPVVVSYFPVNSYLSRL
ncbi:hypothetical protein TorRG33x02_338130 [Trema orientale]|uniref:Uncharacterized protein n=1 Tax=Trema orientale TaxID=63057 RepID=A0A2P5AXZ0_TREOI|nr:hypothetical protein TorRG33x02_338130 [Trema orientale]